MSLGRTLLMVFRWGIFLLACVFLYTRLAGPKGIVASVGSDLWPSASYLLVLFTMVGLLMLVNWLLEAYKWRILMRPVEQIGIKRAFVATIAGTSVGLVTINRTGEFLGRVLFLSPENRVRGSFATALGGIAQFVITLVFGGIGLLALIVFAYPLPWPSGWLSWMLGSLTTLITIVALALYLQPALFRQMLLSLPVLKRLERASQVLGQQDHNVLLLVLVLSGARYAVFGVQFVLLLKGLGSGLSLPAAVLAVPVIYLIATLIPSVMLTELGVRGSVAVAVLVPLGAHAPAVLLATTCLWTINVALPAIAGSVILLMARIRTKQAGV